MFALVELYQTLRAAWHAADIARRLGAWWHVVRHRAELDRPLDVVVIQGAGDAT